MGARLRNSERLKILVPQLRALQQAVRAKCRDCCYDERDTGTWLQQVGRCGCRDCPLWPIRPGADIDSERDSAIIGEEGLSADGESTEGAGTYLQGGPPVCQESAENALGSPPVTGVEGQG